MPPSVTRSSSTPVTESKSVVPDVPALGDIKKSIPADLFRPSVFASLAYVVKDASLIALTFAATYTIVNAFAYGWLLLPAYWFLQGTLFWAVFVLGHDCGHGSFSRYPLLNSVMGNLLHTFILVPFEPWKLSHRHHHKNTGNMDKDEIFYPIREREAHLQVRLTTKFYFGLGFAWFAYLVGGYNPRPTCHLNPWEQLYLPHFLPTLISVSVWFSWVSAVTYFTFQYSALAFVAIYYLAPVFVFASWLVVVTFLHHNEPEKMTWYSDSNWNYTLGNLESIDRDYGVLHGLTHNIGTHQVHHLFPAVPHYNLLAATAAFRKAFPELIKESKAPIWKSFVNNFKSFAHQQIVGNDAETYRFPKKPKNNQS